MSPPSRHQTDERSVASGNSSRAPASGNSSRLPPQQFSHQGFPRVDLPPAPYPNQLAPSDNNNNNNNMAAPQYTQGPLRQLPNTSIRQALQRQKQLPLSSESFGIPPQYHHNTFAGQLTGFDRQPQHHQESLSQPANSFYHQPRHNQESLAARRATTLNDLLRAGYGPQPPDGFSCQVYQQETHPQAQGGFVYQPHHLGENMAAPPQNGFSHQPYNPIGTMAPPQNGFLHQPYQQPAQHTQSQASFSHQPHHHQAHPPSPLVHAPYNTPYNLPRQPQCVGCLSNAPQPTTFAPGPIFAQIQPCGHTMCRSCLSTRYFTSNTHPQCVCGDYIGYPINAFFARLHLDDVYLLSPSHQHVLSSPGADTAVVLENKEWSRALWNAVYRLALRYHNSVALSFHGLGHEFLANQIEMYISACTFPRLTTPTLLYEELKVQLEDVVLWHMAKRPGSKYEPLGKYFDKTGDAERDFKGVCLLVKGMKGKDSEIGKGLGVWEGMLGWYVGVLARGWWERFGTEQESGVVV